MFSAHDILGVPSDASPEKIKEAYHSKIKILHPDKGGDTSLFIIVQQAYEKIKGQQPKPKKKSNNKQSPKPKPKPKKTRHDLSFTADIEVKNLNIPITAIIDRRYWVDGFRLRAKINVITETETGFWWWKTTLKNKQTISGTFDVEPECPQPMLLNFGEKNAIEGKSKFVFILRID